MSKPKIYIILGAAGSGRRQVLSDLLADDLASGAKPLLLLSADEAPSEWDSRCGDLARWTFTADKRIEATLPAGTEEAFLMLDGRRNPVDQLEACRAWLEKAGAEVARILCVVHCQLAEKHPELLVWYDACVHFADVVLLNRRDGVSNKWVADFKARYEKQFFPCLFEFVKDGRVKNPALILQPQAMRISQAFDEDLMGLPMIGGDTIIEDTTEDETNEEDDEARAGDDEGLLPPVEPYFERRLGGRRVKEIPAIADYLDSGGAGR